MDGHKCNTVGIIRHLVEISIECYISEESVKCGIFIVLLVFHHCGLKFLDVFKSCFAFGTLSHKIALVAWTLKKLIKKSVKRGCIDHIGQWIKYPCNALKWVCLLWEKRIIWCVTHNFDRWSCICYAYLVKALDRSLAYASLRLIYDSSETHHVIRVVEHA